jgi:hypothetical protein
MIIFIACMGCHLHWLAVLMLPVAVWVMKIIRHKRGKCPCDCHEKKDITKFKQKNLYQPLGDDEVEYTCKVLKNSETGKPLNIRIPKKTMDKIEKENLELIEKIQPKHIRCKRSKCITPEACKDAGYCYYQNDDNLRQNLRNKIESKK